MTDRIYTRFDKYALAICDEVTFGYDDFVPNSGSSVTRYSNQKITYALLPCWFLCVEYDGIRYQYIVNGQTGKVSGEFPYSKGWETIERTGRRARMEAVSLNTGLRAFLYLIPSVLYGVARGLLNTNISRSKTAEMLFNNPMEVLLILITAGAFIYLCVEILPKVLLSREKSDIAKLSQTNKHDLAPEPGVANYYDTSFPITAYETTHDWVSLESGWKYSEEADYDFKSARPEAEEVEENENATDFEKQGLGRRMMQDNNE